MLLIHDALKHLTTFRIGYFSNPKPTYLQKIKIKTKHTQRKEEKKNLYIFYSNRSNNYANLFI